MNDGGPVLQLYLLYAFLKHYAEKRSIVLLDCQRGLLFTYCTHINTLIHTHTHAHTEKSWKIYAKALLIFCLPTPLALSIAFFFPNFLAYKMGTVSFPFLYKPCKLQSFNFFLKEKAQTIKLAKTV